MSLIATLTRLTDLPVGQVVAASRPCEIRIISDRADFEALAEPWSALFERAARPDHVFQSFNWLWHWCNHFLDDATELALVTGWQAGRLVMVWPLVRTRVAGVRVLRWMGEPASQYNDVLIEPGQHAASMLSQGLDALSTMDADVAFLRKVRRDGSVSALLATKGRAVSCTEAPRLDFAGASTFEEVEARFSSKDRSCRRRLARRLAETGPIVYDDAATGAKAATFALGAIAMKRGSLARHGRSSPALEQPAMQAFFRDAMSSVEHPVGAMINAILRGGQPIGIALSLVCKGVGFGHILAHDGACDKQGVGALLAEQVFRSAHRRGLDGFDMLAPAEAFKLKWASSVARLDDWALPFNLRGSCYMRLWVQQLPRLKHFAETCPQWLSSSVWWLHRWRHRSATLAR